MGSCLILEVDKCFLVQMHLLKLGYCLQGLEFQLMVLELVSNHHNRLRELVFEYLATMALIAPIAMVAMVIAVIAVLLVAHKRAQVDESEFVVVAHIEYVV